MFYTGFSSGPGRRWNRGYHYKPPMKKVAAVLRVTQARVILTTP